MRKPSAVKDMDRLRKYDAVMVADGVEIYLSHNPTKESKSVSSDFEGYRILTIAFGWVTLGSSIMLIM